MYVSHYYSAIYLLCYFVLYALPRGVVVQVSGMSYVPRHRVHLAPSPSPSSTSTPSPSLTDLYQNRRPFTKSYLLDLSLLTTTVTIPPSPFSHSPLTPPVGVALTPQTTPLSSLPSFLGMKRTLRERNPTTL
ncbi:hypothetical protein GBAR_LOCUS14415 [Geodia barretti]|uniref:Uncharacterized protein n=1 Tax=Geodia barretti TaxID=519541 RepID=A0AA35WKK6_GEOBA|nr:hypothetical protein GBAR_LOCUS14415 [Geodia barretti]